MSEKATKIFICIIFFVYQVCIAMIPKLVQLIMEKMRRNVTWDFCLFRRGFAVLKLLLVENDQNVCFNFACRDFRDRLRQFQWNFACQETIQLWVRCVFPRKRLHFWWRKYQKGRFPLVNEKIRKIEVKIPIIFSLLGWWRYSDNEMVNLTVNTFALGQSFRRRKSSLVRK